MAKYKGELGLLFTTIIWGFGFPITSIGLRYATPYQVMVLRFLIASILLSVIFYKSLKKIDKQNLTAGLIVGFILFFAFMTQTLGMQFTTASKCAFLTTTNVVMVPLIGFFFFKQPLAKYSTYGAIMALMGAVILSLPGDFFVNFSVNKGDVFSILCAVGFACHVYFTGHFLNKGVDPICLTIVQMSMAAVCSVLFLLFIGGGNPFVLPKEGWYAIIYMGVVSTTFSFLLQTVSQRRVTNQTRAVVILSMESVFGTIASVLIIHDVLTVRMLLGSAIILCGVLLSELGPSVFGKRTANV